MKNRDGQGKEAFRKREPTGLWSVMYPAHFGLQENPFATDADPKVLWLGEKRKEALESLLSGILSGEGVQVVIGKPGTGKTMLADTVLTELGDRALAAVVPCAEYKGIDFLKLVERAYGISENSQSQGSFFSRFSEFLHRTFTSGKKVVLIVDDAHKLISPYLNELSELFRVEENGTRLLSIVFFGESRFLDLLHDEPNPELAEGVLRRYTLDPLTKEETSQYIQYHLQRARCERELFEPGAIEEVFAYSQGVPRLINRACDAALSRAYYLGEQLVLPDTVKEALNLMPAEKTVPAGSVPDFSFTMGAAANRERDEDADEEDEPGIPVGQLRKRERSPNSLAYAILGVVVVASVGVAFMFMKSSEQRVPASVTEKKIEVPQASPAVRGTVTPPEEMTRDSEIPAQQQAPGVTAEGITRKGQEVRAVRKKTRETAASRQLTGKLRQAPAASPSREAVTSGGVSPGSDVGRSNSGDSGETSSREPARQGTEEMESGKVIDWLIKKRSE
jgi:type II secretory pathway predicted ATPase ExeA